METEDLKELSFVLAYPKKYLVSQCHLQLHSRGLLSLRSSEAAICAWWAVGGAQCHVYVFLSIDTGARSAAKTNYSV